MQVEEVRFRIDVHGAPGHREVLVTADRVLDVPTAPFPLDPDSDQWKRHQDRLSRQQTSDQFFREIGTELFESILPPPLRISYEINYQYARDDLDHRVLRIQLRLLSDAIADLPWECIFHPVTKTWLAANPHTPLSRYVDAQAPPPMKLRPPLRLLIATAEPTTMPSVGAEHEVAALQEVIGPLLRDGLVTTKRLDHATRMSLQRAMAEFSPHLFHFIGHGQRIGRTTGLVLETRRGGDELLPAETLRELLGQSGQVRAVVLNACDTGGCALALARAGMAAIGMRDKVRTEAAIPFCRSFYEAVANLTPLDIAANRARFAVRLECGGDRRDWSLPAIFLPAGRANLFEIERTVRVAGVSFNPARAASETSLPPRYGGPSKGDPQPSEAPATARFDENIQFTVYRPKAVQPEKWYLMPAFAHLCELPPDAQPDEADPIKEVQRQAKAVLGEKAEEYQDVTQDSSQAVPRSGELTFVPEIPGIEFNPPSRTFQWQESVHKEEFHLRALAELDGQTARGRMSVFLGSILLADVNLSIRVDSAYQPKSEMSPVEVSRSVPYRKIFASYSRKDARVVEQLEAYAVGVGDRYLRDCRDLQAGQVWSKELAHLIDAADVFQLFWSHNSMHSPFVRREWEYALALGRPGFVRPTYWEEPLPQSEQEGLPPDELQELSFQKIHHVGCERGQGMAPPPDTGPAAAESPPDGGERSASGLASTIGKQEYDQGEQEMVAKASVGHGGHRPAGSFLMVVFGGVVPAMLVVLGMIVFPFYLAPSPAPNPPAPTPKTEKLSDSTGKLLDIVVSSAIELDVMSNPPTPPPKEWMCDVGKVLMVKVVDQLHPFRVVKGLKVTLAWPNDLAKVTSDLTGLSLQVLKKISVGSGSFEQDDVLDRKADGWYITRAKK